MLAGRDSEFAPSDAELDAAWAAGVRVWGCYFAGPNVANGWSDADILRVKVKGFVVIAFCSGYSDPAACGARARALSILACLDDESGMRPDGDWVEGWCATAGAGLYGNGSFHYNAQGIRPAAFHIFAGYFGYDPGATWPNFDVRPPTPCGWQFLGSHTEFGGSVDSAWYDDGFSLAFGVGGGSLTARHSKKGVRRLIVGNKAFEFLRGDSGATSRALYVREFSAGVWSPWRSLGGNIATDDLGGVEIIPVVDEAGNICVTIVGADGAHLYDYVSTDGGATFKVLDGFGSGDGLVGISATPTATAGAPVDLSGVTQAANDAKAAAVAAQSAAQAASQAVMGAATTIDNAVADIKAIRAKTDKDLS